MSCGGVSLCAILVVYTLLNFAAVSSNGQRESAQTTTPTTFNEQSNGKAPNIILIMTDDQDIELGSMNYMPKTVKILRDGGAEFPNAFVTTPMCCPSRSSMLTGMYVHNHNVYTNNDNCSSPMWRQTHESRAFATYLSNVGYRTGYFGKYLNEYSGDYIPPGYREWMGLIRNSRFYNYTVNWNGNKIKHGNVYENDYFPDLIANDSITFLRQSKQYFNDKPVMMVMSFPSPHGPEDAAPQYSDLFMNVTSHRTPSWNYAPNPDKQWILRYTGKMEPIHIKFTDFLHSKRLQTLQSVDDAVERIYNELAALGELDNTYIVYTSDHGYHLGQFGLLKGKSMPFEFDIRVPFFVRGPNVPRGVKIPNIVLNVDLAPTFLDIAGIAVPDHMDGKSFVKLLKQANQVTRSGRKLYNGEVKRRKGWRDTFLIERGKLTSRQLKEYSQVSYDRLSKDEKLELECQKTEYFSPCRPYQRWECIHDGTRWRIQKCRAWPKKRNYEDECVCPPAQRPKSSSLADVEARISKMHRDERRMQRHFLKIHINNRDFQPKFIGARSKRQIGNTSNGYFMATDSLDFDVNGVFEMNKIIDLTLHDDTEANATHRITKRTVKRSYFGSPQNCNSRSGRGKKCTDQMMDDPNTSVKWKSNKENINREIKALRSRIDELKNLRKRLRGTKPVNPENVLTDYEKQLTSTSRPTKQCNCTQNYKAVRHNRRKAIREERRRIKEAKLRRKQKRQKKKQNYDKYMCNSERMNCFSHNNDHWKTPPLWTYGPFCFCQNANNNTYWCLRTINETHNFLYCEFITGFLCYYDLNSDPYQLRNIIYNLDFYLLQELRLKLNKLRKCKGWKECTVRHQKSVEENEENVGDKDSGETQGVLVDDTDAQVVPDEGSGATETKEYGSGDVNVASGDALIEEYDDGINSITEQPNFTDFPNKLNLDLLKDEQFIPV